MDDDGNSAIHLAAANGLGDCVIKLIEKGAIISIVNRDQKTCCELADTGDSTFLAGNYILILLPNLFLVF